MKKEKKIKIENLKEIPNDITFKDEDIQYKNLTIII